MTTLIKNHHWISKPGNGIGVQVDTAETRDGRRVTLDIGTPVYKNGELLGFNTYMLGVDGYAVRVFEQC